MTEPFNILFVHNDPTVRVFAADALRQEFPEAQITAVGDSESLERALVSNGFDIAIADYSLRWGDGPAVFQSIKNRWPECPVVVFSVSGEDEAVLRALQGSNTSGPGGWPQFLTLLTVAVRSAKDKARLERERRLAADRLRESEARFRSVFESATDGIILADPDGRIISWNRAAAEMFGYSDHEIVGRPLSSLMPARYRERHEAGVRRQRSGGTSRIIGRTVEMFGLRRDGTEFPIDLAVGTWQTERGRFYSGIVRDITHRKQNEERLRASNEELRYLSARIEAIQEEERTSIARELHDELGQALTAIHLDIAWVEKRLRESGPEHGVLLQRLERMDETIAVTASSVRRISAQLRPTMLDELGLVATLDWQAHEFSERTGISCSFRSTLGEEEVCPEITTAMYRILRECLTNVARHAGARTVEVSLNRDPGVLVMSVRDDGHGIDEVQVRNPRSLGLTGMRERCLSLGGELVIEGAPDRGTRVVARIPFASAVPQEAAS